MPSEFVGSILDLMDDHCCIELTRPHSSWVAAYLDIVGIAISLHLYNSDQVMIVVDAFD